MRRLFKPQNTCRVLQNRKCIFVPLSGYNETKNFDLFSQFYRTLLLFPTWQFLSKLFPFVLNSTSFSPSWPFSPPSQTQCVGGSRLLMDWEPLIGLRLVAIACRIFILRICQLITHKKHSSYSSTCPKSHSLANLKANYWLLDTALEVKLFVHFFYSFGTVKCSKW